MTETPSPDTPNGPPTAAEVFQAIDATWAPAEMRDSGPWRLRRGMGGGQRVSAATLLTPAEAIDDDAISQAVDVMSAFDQSPIFMVRDGEAPLARRLEGRGFRRASPTIAFALPVERLEAPAPMAAIPCAVPLAYQREIWEAAGIGPARLAVMDRVRVPKSYLLARHEDRPIGTAFAAVAKGQVMMHALEIMADKQRLGGASRLTAKAAAWGKSHGATNLVVLVEEQNERAIALYQSLGMTECTRYAYWRAD